MFNYKYLPLTCIICGCVCVSVSVHMYVVDKVGVRALISKRFAMKSLFLFEITYRMRQNLLEMKDALVAYSWYFHYLSF